MSEAHQPLNLGLLRSFVFTVESGTMTAAAERLHVTQSAVSLAVGRLEDAMGAQLLVRSRSAGLRLTAAGSELLPRAQALLEHADQVREAMEAAGATARGRLSVGCFRTVAPFLLPPVLELLRREHPELALDFVEGAGPEIEAALLQGRCEVAVIDSTAVSPRLRQEPLLAVRPHVLVAPGHPLAGRASVTVDELGRYDLVLLDIPPSERYFNGVFAAAGVEPTIRHRASTIELVRSLVARGEGYGLLASRPASDVSWEGLPLRTLELDGDVEPVRFALAWLAGGRQTARAGAFAAACHAVARRTQPAG